MSIDRREDAGDFYPGGKVISTRPVATGGDVKHSDFAGLDVKTNTIPDLREAVRQLGRRLGATVVTALAVCVAIGATVQTVSVNDLDFDANPSVVTNVVFDAPPDYSTNNTELVETIEATAPAPGNYAAVSNAAMNAAMAADVYTKAEMNAALNGLQRDITHYGQLAENAVASVNGKTGNAVTLDAKDIDILMVRGNATTNIEHAVNGLDIEMGITFDAVFRRFEETQEKLPYPTNAIPYAAVSGKPTNVSAFNNDAGYLTSYTETDPTISSWAKAASKPTYTADEVGAVSSNKIEEVRTDNAQTRQIVTTWENFLDGSNVVFSITNYLSGAYNLGVAKLKILELRDGEYHEVYNSRDEILLHIDDFSNRYVRVAINAIVDEVAARLASKADKDWGKYTSAGGEAPSNTVYMTAPNTVFAGGLEYERVAVGEGTICVLTTRGAPTWTQGDEGTFKFQDDGGTNYFGFAKTDSYTIGANTDGITVQGGMVTMNYNITMSGRPCVWYKSSLSSGAWEQLNLPDGSPVAGASHAVTWEANPDPGTQVCYINVGNAPSGFFRATIEVAGEAKFMTNMPADMSGGIFCTDGEHKVRPVYNNGSVTWEVFQ